VVGETTAIGSNAMGDRGVITSGHKLLVRSHLVVVGDFDGKHNLTYHVFMKNVTVALDETTLRDARRIAAERSTSLNALIRDFLERLTQRESHARSARRRIEDLCRASTAEVGERGWSRDELHER
jgi:hypothetical protein